MDYSAIKTCFLDMDGVMFDWIETFNKVTGLSSDDLDMLSRKEQLEHVKKMACEYSRHYAELKPIKEVIDCFKKMIRLRPDIDFKVLTSVGKFNIEHLIEQKKECLRLHFPEIGVDENFRFTIRSKDKAHFAGPGVVLIDDFAMVRALFVEYGGIAIDGSDIDAVSHFCDSLCNVECTV